MESDAISRQILWNSILKNHDDVQELLCVLLAGDLPPQKNTLELKLGRVGVSRGWKKMYKSLSHVSFMVVSQVGILWGKTIMLLLLFLFPLCFIFFSNPEHLFLILFSSSLLSLSSQKFCELQIYYSYILRELHLLILKKKYTAFFLFSVD